MILLATLFQSPNILIASNFRRAFGTEAAARVEVHSGVSSVFKGAAIAMLAGFLLCLRAVAAEKGLVLAENGQPKASIVIAAEPDAKTKLAAEELQSYVAGISGAKLPIVNDAAKPAGVALLVGRSKATDALGVKVPSGFTNTRREEGFIIATRGERILLARRTGDLLNASALPTSDPIVSPLLEAGFRALFDGTAATFKHWRLAGPAGGGMAHIGGEMVSYGDGGLRLFYDASETFGDFTLRLQFRIFDAANHNSGVFLRFPRPTHDLTAALQTRIPNEKFYDPNNPAWKPVLAGFEVQIDDNARGDSSKDFHGISPEPDGLFKSRTGAIYKIPAGDHIWHLNMNEPATQTYTPGLALVPNVWFEYEIIAQGDDYTVFLTNTETGERKQTTKFKNSDPARGRAPGFIGVQAYSGSTVAWRHIRIKSA